MTMLATTPRQAAITAHMRRYYTHYYRHELGLPDWQRRVEDRLHEEDTCEAHIANLETWINYRFDASQQVLVVGGGTGAEFLALSQRGCSVYAVEPAAAAVHIGQLKALDAGYDPARFLRGVGERLPFNDDTFDFVWCFTVLEHVQDVRTCVHEIVRVTRPLGRIFLATPDYRQWYEPHYKLPLPMFAPKWINRLLLVLLGRPPAFLDTLQLVNSHRLGNMFQHEPVTAMHILHAWPQAWLRRPTLHMSIIMWITHTFGIQRDQYWLLQKLAQPR